MKDEIKEILEQLQDEYSYWLDCGFKITSLSYDKAHLLLDYITNLQEELESKNKEIKDLKNRLYVITTKFN